MRATPLFGRSWPALAFVALLLGAALAVPPAGAQEPVVKIMVLGETHGTKSMTKSLVNIAQSKGATGCICPGDFTYGHWDTSPSQWRSMMQPFMGNMMPAQGNHDWPWSDWSQMFPGGKHYYSKDVNGVQVIALNTEYSLASGSTQRQWLEARLSERDPGALKIVQMHRPWWLPDGARHPISEFESKNGASAASMNALMEKHGVDLVVSAHEKNYQHSVRNGVHYLVAGGGGPEFYGMSYHLPGAVKRLQSNVVSLLDVTPSSMTLKSYDMSWAKVEEFTMTASGASAPAPTSASEPAPGPSSGAASVSFTPYEGGEWWVQTKISGTDATRVAKIEAKDDNTPWTTLTLRSWGAWATSFRVEPGNSVTYRATLTDGRVVESCAYAHPSASCSSSAPAPAPAPTPTTSTGAASVTFAPYDGGEWWVQTKISGTDATRVAKVEAKDDNTAWTTLTLRSWGAWATSFRVEPGNSVTYRATLTDGRVVESCAYAHPSTSCASGASGASPAPSAYAAEFRNARGNAWWVEVEARAQDLASVDARVDGGAWKPLSRTAWGSWATSTSAPTGSTVEFRATGAGGQQAVSAAYAWPPA